MKSIIDLPYEDDTSSGAIDYQPALLLRVENLSARLQSQIENVDIAALKRGFAAAAERPADVELLKQEKRCLEDDLTFLQAEYDKLLHDAEGNDSVIEILNSQVKEHEQEVANLRAEVELAMKSACHRTWKMAVETAWHSAL